MSFASPTSLRVAAVQIASTPGAIAANLAHAEPFVARAAAAGAKLVVLPELFAPGYRVRAAALDLAEPADGPTTRWLGATAQRLGIHLGGGHSLRDGGDFYNVFTLCSREGRVVARVLKSNAEASVFRRGAHSHVVDCALGRIGIGICADNQFGALAREFREGGVDLVLMPHAWPIARHAEGRLVSEEDVLSARRNVAALPRTYAELLGVPVMFVNQTGPFEGIEGLLGGLMKPSVFGFPGLSRVVDAHGETIAALASDEDALVADVMLDVTAKRRGVPIPRGWLLPGNPIARHLLVPVDIAAGRTRYALRRWRRRVAPPGA